MSVVVAVCMWPCCANDHCYKFLTYAVAFGRLSEALEGMLDDKILQQDPHNPLELLTEPQE